MLDTDNRHLAHDLRDEIGAISICPLCAAGIDWGGETIACTNATCGRRFRLTGGIPVLADEDTSAIAFDPGRASANRSAAKSFALRYLPTLDLNVMPESARARLHEEVFALSPRPVILNVGGKHPTSMTEALCARPDVQAIECDLAHRARTRVFADPSRIPLADASVDAVLLDAVLEHVPDAHAVVREAWRVLRPGGIIYADTPFMLQVHGGAFDYARFSHQAQRWMFRDFVEIDSGVSQGPAVALGYAIQYFLLCFVSGRTARYAVKTFCRLAFFWIKYFDLLIARRPAARDAAHGMYFLGRKSNRSLTEREVVARYDGDVPHLYPPQG
jgi:SAM-dependent methyltransferase